MKITKMAGRYDDKDASSKEVDWLEVEWEELAKRILRKDTEAGRDISISLEPGEHLETGGLLYEDENLQIAVRTTLEDVYVITPASMTEMGKVAFELGNRHTPCLVEDDNITVRYDSTLETIFKDIGVAYKLEQRRIDRPFKYKGHAHAH